MRPPQRGAGAQTVGEGTAEELGPIEPGAPGEQGAAEQAIEVGAVMTLKRLSSLSSAVGVGAARLIGGGVASDAVDARTLERAGSAGLPNRSAAQLPG